MELSEDDVLHILKLIDESKFDYFQLEVGELKKNNRQQRRPDPNSRYDSAREHLDGAGACHRGETSHGPRGDGSAGGESHGNTSGTSRRHGTDPRDFLCGARARRAAVCDRRPTSH